MVFPEGLYHFVLHQQRMRDLVSPQPCQHLVFSLFFIFPTHDGIPSWFSLPFHNGYPCNLFGEVIVQVLCPFFFLCPFELVFCFSFLLSFEGDLYILDTSPFSDNVACKHFIRLQPVFFSFLTLSFKNGSLLCL